MKSKKQKHDEAVTRNIVYESRTITEQLRRLDLGKFAAKKERSKLIMIGK